MQHLATVIFGCAGVAWIVALVSGIRMVKNRAPGVTIGYLATHGIAFFRDTHFTAAAALHRRRLYIAFAVFVALVVAGAVVGAVAASPAQGA